MITERVVLGRVEHFEQGRGRIATEVRADLVHLVEHDDRVHGPCLTQGTHQASGLGPDVGTTVTTDFGFVTHTAQGDPDELASHGTSDRLPERRLADAGGTDEGQNGSRAAPVHRHQTTFGLELAHGEVLENPLFDVGQTVVVGVQNAGGLDHFEAVVGLHAPGELEDRVEPGTDPACLGALLIGALELVDLALDRHPDMFGEVALGQLGPVVIGVGLVALAPAELSQLLAYGFELTAEKELALRLLHALLDVRLDPLTQREIGQGVTRPAEDQPQPRLDVDRLEHLDLLGQREVGRVARHVGQPARLGDVAQLRGNPAGTPAEQDVLEDRPVLPSQFSGGRRRLALVERLSLDPQRRPCTGHSGTDGGALVTRTATA